MARKVKSRCILDTSALIYHLHGHTLQRKAVQESVQGLSLEVPVFVRMEYLRGVVINLIDMHSLIKESATVEDALIDWSQQIRQERKLKVVLMTLAQWLSTQEDWARKERSLTRLGNLILQLIWSLGELFPTPPEDPLGCLLGRVAIEKQAFRDDLLLDFYDRFQEIRRSTPACSLCAFRETQEARLRMLSINIFDHDLQQQYASNPGFQRQLSVLQEVQKQQDRKPGCRWCERLGDTIIAFLTSEKVQIITADKTFLAFGEVLKIPVVLLPSLAELKRQNKPAAQSESR